MKRSLDFESLERFTFGVSTFSQARGISEDFTCFTMNIARSLKSIQKRLLKRASLKVSFISRVVGENFLVSCLEAEIKKRLPEQN